VLNNLQLITLWTTQSALKPTIIIIIIIVIIIIIINNIIIIIAAWNSWNVVRN